MGKLWPASMVMDMKAEETVDDGKKRKEQDIMPRFQTEWLEGNTDHQIVKAGQSHHFIYDTR